MSTLNAESERQKTKWDHVLISGQCRIPDCHCTVLLWRCYAKHGPGPLYLTKGTLKLYKGLLLHLHPPFQSMSEMWAPNDCPPSSGAETINATSTIVLTALQSAGSTVPGLGVAAEIALRIIALVQVHHSIYPPSFLGHFLQISFTECQGQQCQSR